VGTDGWRKGAATGGTFEEFYAATVDRLHGQLFVVTGDLHETEEVVQEALSAPPAAGRGCKTTTCRRPGCGGWP
jgi:hypothetical protein